MQQIRLAVRQLVEFLLQTGDIDSRFAGFDRANEGARIHRKLQKQAGEGYQPEVFLSGSREVDGIRCTVEGRADGIFTDSEGRTVIDEIKTTGVPSGEISAGLNFCHWAQGMVYAALYAAQQDLPEAAVRLTYYQIDDDKMFYFTCYFSRDELEDFFLGLLRQYAPWARHQLDWDAARAASLQAMRFPYASYRPGQRALAGEVYRACKTGREAGKGGFRLFCQAPTGTGKTMSALFPSLKAMGEGTGEKSFYFTARTTARAAAEDAVALLRQANPGLVFRSVTLTAKEKVCLAKNEAGRPVCMPEACPYARGYYDRRKEALAALLDGGGQLDRPAIEAAARQFTVCPFELGLDLSAAALFRAGRGLDLPHRRGAQPARPGPGDVLGQLCQEQHHRGQAGFAAGQKRPERPPAPGGPGTACPAPGSGSAGAPPAHGGRPRECTGVGASPGGAAGLF